MKWITRSHVHVDRVACPWLITRFVDSRAEFIFAARDLVAAVAEREGAVPFDVEGAELGHHGGSCSFVAILDKYALRDPALRMLGDLVNAADTGRPQDHPLAPALLALAEGFSLLHPDDHDNVASQFGVYDSLYSHFKRVAAQEGGK